VVENCDFFHIPPAFDSYVKGNPRSNRNFATMFRAEN